MINVPLTEEALKTALGRFSDFKLVHEGKGDYREAFSILRESLGVSNDVLVMLQEGIEEILNGDDPELIAGTLFGLLIGLIAADYASTI